MAYKVLGRYIVADPRICHGKPTFRGTRIMVAQVLEQVAGGMDWKTIEAEWQGRGPEAAIAETGRVAKQGFCDHGLEYAGGVAPA